MTADVEPAVELAADLALDADELEAAARRAAPATPSPPASMRAITEWKPWLSATSKLGRAAAGRCPAPCWSRCTYTESSTVVR